MSIAYAGGTLSVKTITVGANCVQDLVSDGTNGIIQALTQAGWTIVDHSQWNGLAGGSNASNGNTATINARVYTFKNVLAVADDIKIGSTALETIQNFKAAINLEAGSGTKYGVGTTLNPDVTAFVACNANFNGSSQAFCGLYTKSALGLAVSSSGSLGWFNATFGTKIFEVTSAQTSQFQRIHAFIGSRPDAPASKLSITVTNRDSSDAVCQDATRAISNGQTYRTIANRYGFWNHIVGTYNTRGTGVYLSLGELKDNQSPRSVTAATNASPIVITTDAAHGFVTGDSVFNKYIAGNTAANGTFTITVTGASTYSLDGSVGNGVMSGALGLSQNLTPPRKSIMEYVGSNFINSSSDEWIVGSVFYHGVGTGAVAMFGVSDGAPFINSSTYNAFFPVVGYQDGSGVFTKCTWSSGDYPAIEPFLDFSGLYGGNTIGPQLYNCFLAQNTSIAGGSAITADGHNWYGVYNNDSRHQLFLMVS